MHAAESLISRLTDVLAPIETKLAHAWWKSGTHSSPAADAERCALELEIRAILADAAAFAEIKSLRSTMDLDLEFDDPGLSRQLDLLHDAFAPNQVPEDLRRSIVELETSVDSTFTTFRAEIDGVRVDDNAIADVLRQSDDCEQRRAAWDASKKIGDAVANDVRKLASLRNAAARSLGYRDHFELALSLSELSEQRLLETLDAVDTASAEPFKNWKHELDLGIAARFDLEVEDLRPWHYDDPFFQEAPRNETLQLDELFADADIEALTLKTFDGLGLNIRTALSKSDLWSREAKSQHAFCIDIDRSGDVRVLANIVGNERWTSTMLHEFGHATYDLEIDRNLPWLLRGPSHALTTEGVAMLCGRLTRDPKWLIEVAQVDPSEVAKMQPALRKGRRAGLLVFARWVLVVTNFERALYADPECDLNTLWWDLVEQFQLITRPSGRDRPDWAAKIHLAVAPVYYQNYLYGELFASQLEETLNREAGGMINSLAGGKVLVERVFQPGSSVRWDHLIEEATGAPIGVDAFSRNLGDF